MLLKAVVGGLEVRNLGQDCSPSSLEGKCLPVCITMAMSCRREYLGSSLGAKLASELNVVE